MKEIRNPNKNNQKRSEEAQRRIQAALALLQERQQLPTAITARATAIRAVSSVSFRTLYKQPEPLASRPSERIQKRTMQRTSGFHTLRGGGQYREETTPVDHFDVACSALRQGF